MNLIEINSFSSEWLVTTGGATKKIEDTLLENKIETLKKLIGDDKYDGGVSKSCDIDVVINLLMEELNIPFVSSKYEGSIEEALDKAKQKCEWILSYETYPKGKQEYAIESLLTVGNGFMGLRGTTPEMGISDANYPATYLAGLYNEATSEIIGHDIVNEDFVNAPNLQKMYLIIDGETINIEENNVEILERELDLRTGELQTVTKIHLKHNMMLEINTKKTVSMSDVHYYGIEYSFKLDGDAEKVVFVSEADGSVYNYNVERYRKLTNKHLTVKEIKEQGVYNHLLVETKHSGIQVLQQSKLMSKHLPLGQVINQLNEDSITQSVTFSVKKNKWYQVEKIVFVDKDSQDKTVYHDRYYPTYQELIAASSKEWELLWQTSGIKVSGDMMSQKMLNLHTYHMLSSGSPKGNAELDASITARGLHGEAYRGHIFWDELFVLPFYLVHYPETAKQLLMYRYNRLEMAKEMAKEEGFKGAMFPWQSGLDGSEQSQKLHLNPLSGEWKEDNSRLQRHVSLAIAYNVWLYWHHTGDHDFMKEYGLEMLLEISRFWLDISEKDEITNRYYISGVMGPDEFHEAYPDAEKGGLTNNAYTNLMVAWLFDTLLEIKTTNQFDESGLTQKEWDKLAVVKNQLGLEISDEGIIAQFAGYFDLKEVDWDFYKEKYGNVYRMDRILNAEGKSADSYKVAKQADSLMVYYNLPKKAVDNLLDNMGYSLPDNYVRKNLEYYLDRTSHGSTLSRVVHAQLAEMIDDRELAWQLYQEALYSDYRDIQGGTTAEGIHTGVMASTLHITLTAFAGLDIRGKELVLEPHLPETWEKLTFTLTRQGIDYSVCVMKEKVSIEVSESVEVIINQKRKKLTEKEVNIIQYKEKSND